MVTITRSNLLKGSLRVFFANYVQFYRVQLLLDESNDEYYTHTRWGRVGEFGAVKTMGPFDLHAAFKEYNSKFKGKTGHNWEDRAKEPKKGKYTFIEKSYEDEEENGGGKFIQPLCLKGQAWKNGRS